MAIDTIGSLSEDQIRAMQLQYNQNNVPSSESDLAFQNILNSYGNSNVLSSADNGTGMTQEQLMAMSLMTNGQLTSSDEDGETSRAMSNQMAYTNMITMKQLQDQAKAGGGLATNNTSKAVDQQCPTGQDLQELQMKIKGGVRSPYVFSKSTVPPANMEEIKEAVTRASKKYGVDENLIYAIIKQESNFNSNAVSSAGAMGLMQVMPANFASTNIRDPYNVAQNVDGGTKIIKECLDKYNNNISLALMAYNGGSGNMQRRGVASEKDLYKMPKETQNYVPSVLRYYRNGFK